MKINKKWLRVWSMVLIVMSYILFDYLLTNPEIFGKWTIFVSAIILYLSTIGYLKLRNLLKTFKWNENTKKWEETIINNN